MIRWHRLRQFHGDGRELVMRLTIRKVGEKDGQAPFFESPGERVDPLQITNMTCASLHRLKFVASAAALAIAASGAMAQQPDVPTLLGHYGCTLCHGDREWVSAPSWADIAAEYRKDRRASAHLIDVVRKGKHGDAVWPMPPLPQVTDADAKRIVTYILEMKP